MSKVLTIGVVCAKRTNTSRGLVGMLLLGLLSSCTPKGESQANSQASSSATLVSSETPGAAKVEPLRVRAVVAELGTLEIKRTLAGTLEAALDSQISSGVNGKVLAVLQHEGAKVKKGQVVIQLEKVAWEEALRSAQLQLKYAQANVRFQRKQRGAGMSDSLELLNIAVEQANVSVQTAQRNLSDTQIKAPFNGLISEMNVSVGQSLAAGTGGFRLIDPSSLRIKFNVSALEGERLHSGMGVVVRSGDVQIKAKIFRSTPALAQNRQRSFYAKLLGSSDFGSLPVGASVEVGYSAKLAHGVQIPSGALEVTGGEGGALEQSRVYVVKNEKIYAKTVQVLAESGGKQIVSGLQVGDQVIYPLSSRVREGILAEVVE
jgi:HlyD family secretion protein